MSDTRDWADNAAREICERLSNGVGFRVVGSDSLEANIALALRAARRVPDGHIREGDVDRKVLGTLLVTKDGCVVGYGRQELWYPGEDQPRHTNDGGAWSFGTFKHIDECYSTRTAAEAARGGE